VHAPLCTGVDSFRTARLSNERRQLLLYELSGKLRRQMGRKVLEAGGNHVLGYQQSFDLEGEHSGVIVARGLGTSVKLRPEAEPRSLLSPRKPEPPEAAHFGQHRLGSPMGRELPMGGAYPLSSPDGLATQQPSPAAAAAHGAPLASPPPAAPALGSEALGEGEAEPTPNAAQPRRAARRASSGDVRRA